MWTSRLLNHKTAGTFYEPKREQRGAFHLVKNSENSGSGLNEKRFCFCFVLVRKRFAQLENSQKKWNCLEGSPVFPVGTSLLVSRVPIASPR